MTQPDERLKGAPAKKARPRTGSDATASETAARILKRDILSGLLAPDTKLKMRELKERYGIGASPMREALAQLAAEGLVQVKGQQGFRVPAFSQDELSDITLSRQIVEVEALKLAIAHADAAWEDEIVSSYHLLMRELDRRFAGAEDRTDIYEEKHHRFHRALIAACPLPSLKLFCDDLYIRLTRYRRVLRTYNFFAKESVEAEHRILMEAVLARDPDRATRALHDHIGITADVTLEVLASSSTQEK
jgi:DNA-binding GntR family transcriptional regulator